MATLPPSPAPAPQRGIATVEVAFALLLMVPLIFGTIEVARALYVWNTVQEVTRSAAREAALTDFADAAAMDALRRRAIFRANAGALVLAPEIADTNVRIDYLSLAADGTLAAIPAATLPACPVQNRINCINDPNGAACIRFVRARVCGSGGDCDPVAYQPMFDLPGSATFSMSIPAAATVVAAETLGHRPGALPCP